MSETRTHPSTLPVAGLDRRFYSYAVDRALEVAACALAALLSWWLSSGSWFVVLGAVVLAGLLVATLLALLVSATAATPGKRWLDLRVVDHATGAPPSFGRAWLRAVLLGLASLPTAGFGVAALALTVLVDPSGGRRGWHDLRTGTVVVDTRPPTVTVEAEAEVPRQVVNLTALRLAPVVPVTPPVRPAPPTRSRPADDSARTDAAGPYGDAADPRGPRPSDDAPEQTVVRGAPAAAEPAAPSPAPVARWRLSVDTGESLLVEGDVLLGRSPVPGSGEQVRHLLPLASYDMSVSKTHARLGLAEDGSLVAQDRGSTNGSLLLRQGVTREIPAGRPTTLVDGDRIRVGDREVLVERET